MSGQAGKKTHVRRPLRRSKPKSLLLTGGASGIGAATARLAVARGHKVLIADIDGAGAEAVARDIGPGASAVALDIRDARQWENALDQAWALFGGLDVLINNAAIARTGRADNVILADHQLTMDVNFMGPLTGMLAALSRFKAQGRGHFVTVCSMTAFLPFPGLASYAAAKHALRAFHHGLAMEQRAAPLDFTIIYPTSTETPMLEAEAASDEAPMAFLSTPVSAETVADIILTAMDRKTREVFMPPNLARTVRLVGTNPRSLGKLIERGEEIGAERLRKRRAARG